MEIFGRRNRAEIVAGTSMLGIKWNQLLGLRTRLQARRSKFYQSQSNPSECEHCLELAPTERRRVVLDDARRLWTT
jgi:hypothetical protein